MHVARPRGRPDLTVQVDTSVERAAVLPESGDAVVPLLLWDVPALVGSEWLIAKIASAPGIKNGRGD